MKQLILFRHGKSDWDAEFEQDHDRPLAKRGIKAAKIMGKLLANSGQMPDRILTSPAIRARSTVELAVKEGNWNCPIEITNALYDVEVTQVVTLIQDISVTIETLLLTGHEPTWSELTSFLIGGGQIRFPTAAMVRIDFEVESWSDINFGRGELIWFLQPRFFTQI